MTDTVKHPRCFNILHAQNGAVVVVEEGTDTLLGAYADRFEALEAIASDWGFSIERGSVGMAQSMGQGFHPPASNTGMPTSCDPNFDALGEWVRK